MDYAKPGEIRRMRSEGQLSQLEFTAIFNMWGRGLKTTVSPQRIAFQNGGNGPSAAITRGTENAVIYTGQCKDHQVGQYESGLAAAGYTVEKV